MPNNSSTGPLTLSTEEFKAIRTLVYDRFGINLTDQKRNLVIGRLQKVLRQHGFSSFSEYVEFLQKEESGESLSELIDRISTNHTFFFREPEHFRFLSQVFLPDIRKRQETKKDFDVRIWSAGCSSGEEPYSIAITLREFFQEDYGRWQAGVLATDISSHVLRHAQRAIYPEERLSRTPADLRRRYFEEIGDGNVRVIDTVQRDVTFRRLNFMMAAFPFKRPFHLISCRNVMIYFDAETRAELTRKFHDVLEPGGYLFIGHSESLGREHGYFEYVQPAVYRRKHS
jgi:chemotaxis protein methyltransferase CheR